MRDAKYLSNFAREKSKNGRIEAVILSPSQALATYTGYFPADFNNPHTSCVCGLFV